MMIKMDYAHMLQTVKLVLLWRLMGTGATYMHIETTGICALPLCHFELDCRLYGTTNKSIPIEFYHSAQDGSLRGPLTQPPKFYIQPSRPKLCSPRSDTQPLWDLKSRLMVSNASDSDAGNYTCRARIPGQDGFEDEFVEATVRVWVQHDTEFQLSSSHLTLNLGDDATVRVHLQCDTTAAIEVRHNNTSSTSDRVLPYMYNHSTRPYVRKTDGWLVIPEFSCEDEGSYAITVHAARGMQLVETTKTVHVEACQGCCPMELQTVPVVSTNVAHIADGTSLTTEQPNEIPNEIPESLAGAQSTPVYLPILIVFIIVSVLANIGFSVIWYRRKRRLNGENSSSTRNAEKDEALESMHLGGTLNDTANTNV